MNCCNSNKIWLKFYTVNYQFAIFGITNSDEVAGDFVELPCGNAVTTGFSFFSPVFEVDIAGNLGTGFVGGRAEGIDCGKGIAVA